MRNLLSTILLILASSQCLAAAVTLTPIPVTQLTLTTLDKPTQIVVPVDMNDYNQWSAIVDTIYAEKYDTLVLKWQGGGGYVYIANVIADAIKQAQADGKTIVIDVIGPSKSSHALAICGAKIVTIEPGGSLLFHSPFAGSLKNGKIIRSPGKLSTASLIETKAKFDTCVQAGYLTKEDVDLIFIKHKAVIVTPSTNGTFTQTIEDDK